MHIDIRKFLWVLACPLFLIFNTANYTIAQSSLNYQLKSSVADQGGALSQSSNYDAVNAVGQASPLGVSNGTNYIVTSGFFAGLGVTTAIGIEGSPILSETFELDQNYPNPFITETIIAFSLPEAGQVKLEIYNILGEQLETVFSEYRSPGVYSVDYHGTSLSPGVYIYKIQTDQYQAVKMMNKVE